MGRERSTPFIVPNVEMLRTDGPNALTSAAYAEDFNEIKEVGSLTSITRTPDQTDAAIFWQDQATRALEPDLSHAWPPARQPGHRRQRAPVCNGEPGCG